MNYLCGVFVNSLSFLIILLSELDKNSLGMFNKISFV